ncbi:type II secretion system F family protein [Aeromicrobium sp. CF4.19]|uniref:type II secretion system F family protein n=1 Tax=Aeromicrobium sp. CF4.19 TaxID=3373082 RepID=UPI003EE7D5D6
MVDVPVLLTGVALVLGAVGAVAYVLLGSTVPRISKDRRRGTAIPQEPLARRAYRGFITGIDAVLRRRGWMPFRASELQQANIRKPASVVVAWLLIGTAGSFVVGFFLGGGLLLAVLFAFAVPVGLKLVLKMRTRKQRKRFEAQLDPTLRIIASALRAGQSLPIAIASVASDAEEPMSDELSRVVNESRVGRDLVEAMLESADRMHSEDFRWFAEAAEVQRDTGGNLNDIIDVVAATIRDRAEIREKVNAYASEGKASMWVLMGLPVALGVLYTIIRPGYLDPLFVTTVGRMLFGASIVLYGIGYVWMRSIVDIKV